jgi:hypothetical protein
MLRHEQALIHVRLGDLAEARKMWLSTVGPPKTDQELQALNISADQLRLHGFYLDALPIYRQLLHDWLPAHPNDPLKRHLENVGRHTVGLILGKLKELWPTTTTEHQHDLLAALLEMLFADGRDADPILPVIFTDQPQTAAVPGAAEPAASRLIRSDAIPELAPSILQFALASGELAALRTEWASHPNRDSIALLALRAEAAAAAQDADELSRLIAELRRVEEESGQSAPLWSVRCLLHGLDDKLREAFEFDFRERKLDRKVFDVSGQSPWLVKPEVEGLRIRLPANVGAIGHVGVRSLFQIHGDFAAIATFEILKIDNPQAPRFYGGAMLIAEFADSSEHANLRRERHPNGEDFYTPHHHSQDAQEQTHTLMRHIPTSATKGRLALVRRGSTMHWLVKDDGESDFRLLQQDACGTQDIATLKVAVDSWGTQSLTDLRWIDLSVRAEKLVKLPAEHLRQPAEISMPGVTLAATPSRRWLWWLAAGIFLTIPAAVLCIRHYRAQVASKTLS